MFCDGVCKKKAKTCGLYLKIFLNDGKEIEGCAFVHLINNSGSLSNHVKDLRSAVESARNEDVESMDRASNKLALAIGKGMLHLKGETDKIKAVK